MGVGLRIGERGSPGARLGALGQKTVDKKTDLFGEGAENGSVGAKGLGKKTDLFVSREGTREQGSLEEFAAAPGHEGADNETDLLGRDVCVVLGPLGGGIRGGRGRRRPW